MGQIQSQVKDQYNKIVTEERKTELKRGLSFFNERACIYKEIALLSKTSFQDAVNGINEMLLKSCKTSKRKVAFHCNMDGGLNWKPKAKVFCFQLDDCDEPVVTRHMSVVQFWTLRSDILKRVGKKYGKDEENQFEFVNSAGDIIDREEIDQIPQAGEEDQRLSTSDIFDRVDELSSEEIECCICMERKSDVSLVCAHCFCKHCIESWQQRMQRSCPMCRQVISEEDEFWEMTDIPDKDEMHNYVVEFASGIPSIPS